ncbi:uncharacterized protein LOC122376326 [Amphibalanus amphitrite]|uniref:uncharacterized protein LOC122376326 n=1 Tax=Amphibalanus amphitrite TaxID=1232801 RepID=UPI001C8FB08D|nr:uncharacterized protein LOC122376326 [Amphibalanus amphitrite]
MEAYNTKTKKVLKILLQERGLKTTGTKDDLIKRLISSHKTSQMDIEPEDSASQISTSSSSSFIKNQRAVDTAKRAELEARSSILEEKRRLLEEELRLKLRQEQLNIEEELAAIHAREKYFAASDIMENTDETTHLHQIQVPGTSSQFVHSDVGHSKTCGAQMYDMAETMLRQQRRSSLPKTEITKFKGDPMEYPMFIRSFISRIETQTENDAERLYFLLQSVTGKPHEIVKGYMHLQPDRGYKDARAALDRKYGDEHRISSAYVDKILSWPQMKSLDVDCLEDFSILIRSCKNAMESLGALSEVNHPRNLQKIVGKLPYQLQEKWRQLVFESSQQNMKSDFGDIVEFVERQVCICSDPVFGVKEMMDAKSSHGKSFKSTFYTATTNSDVRCYACDECHTIESCPVLLQMDISARIEKIKEKRLCFACLRPNHVSKHCRRRMQCRHCDKRHPSLLHVEFKPVTRPSLPPHHDSVSTDPNSSTPQNKLCGGTKAVTSGTVLPVLPVQLSVSGKAPVKTYAFLDNGSQSTFITEELRSQLGQTGEETLLTITTVEHTASPVKSRLVTGLHVADVNGNNSLPLPPVYTIPTIPVGDQDVARTSLKKQWSYLEIEIPEVKADKIGILIGCDCPKAMEPWEVIHSQNGGPYALKTCLGWTVVGPKVMSEVSYNAADVKVNTVRLETEKLQEMMITIFNNDFTDKTATMTGYENMSQEDKLWKAKVEGSVQLKNGSYEIALPFKAESVRLPNNRALAERRAIGLKKRLERDPALHIRYTQYMNGLLEKGHAEPASMAYPPEEGKMWYIPHHSVQHPAKPEKTRVVFDGSARYGGTSLNDQLLQGPNLSNTLIGVLIRFRKERVAFMADIQEMFYQVQVPSTDVNFYRFLWWPEGDTTRELEDFVMKKHIFGSVSSPGCANFALQKCAQDNHTFSPDAAKTIQYSFYIDDCLKSVESINKAVTLVRELKQMCAMGGFNLTKFVSNHREVTESLPDHDKTENMKGAELGCDTTAERALGVLWDFQQDRFRFKVKIQSKPLTRRGILSATSSFFDPLGIAAPVLMVPKLILQELCTLNLGWDDIIPMPLQQKWLRWHSSLCQLELFSVERCMKPGDFGRVLSTQIHHFADASQAGYGAVSYLRQVDDNGKIHCSFLIGKARVAPLKSVTIPRMELTAATLAVRLDLVVKEELQTVVDSTVFWTDSTTVLRYIKNKTSRFHIYVANRIGYILEHSDENQWKYVTSKVNPADEASRSTTVEKFLNESMWVRGPEFLTLPEDKWPEQPFKELETVMDGDPEVKMPKLVSATSTETQPTDKLLQHYSNWYRLKRAVAYYMRLKQVLRDRIKKEEKPESRNVTNGGIASDLSVEELQSAEMCIVKYVQAGSFSEELAVLHSPEHKKITKKSNIYRLDPVCESGVLRVGGRLSHAYASEASHPAILPARSHVTDLIISDTHRKIGHSGRLHVLSVIRERFWIIRGMAAVRRVLSRCVFCRRLHGRPLTQKMADLPQDRVTPDLTPFAVTGVDLFGPFYVKRGRATVKRFGVIFVCQKIRAVHLEVVHSLTTHSFINALRRFMARRGAVRIIRCDNGTNFVGARRELKEEIRNWNQQQIEDELLQKEVKWIFNAPGASHHGGTWERLIRETRKILNFLLQQKTLEDECLSTFMCEVEAILNGRPLTPVSDDPRDLEALTPNHLLIYRSAQPLPPGIFSEADSFSRKRWKLVQYLATEFWRRWKKEYVSSLQVRQKWIQPQRNLRENDMVLLVDADSSRNEWKMGRVINVYPDAKGNVRVAEVRTSTSILRRPISKLVLLLPEDGASTC